MGNNFKNSPTGLYNGFEPGRSNVFISDGPARLAVKDTSSLGGWNVGSRSPVATYRHEYGHHTWFTRFNAIQRAEWDNVITPMKNWDIVSRYAGSDSHELFAESFAHFTAPVKVGKRQLPVAIRKFMEANIGEL